MLRLIMWSKLNVIAASYAVVLLCSNAFSVEVALKPVKFQALGKIFQGSEIQKKGDHALNRLARKVDREFDALKIIHSDELLRNSGSEGTRGAYTPENHILFISQAELEKDTIGPVVLHELVHAKLWVELRHLILLGFHGQAFNDKPELRGRNYGPFFGLDEVPATFFSVRYHIKIMRSELDRQRQEGRFDPEKLISLSFEVRDYTSRLRRMLATLSQGIDEATETGRTPIPESLNFLPKSITWQKYSTKDIRLFFPLKVSAETIEAISTFAKDAVSTFEQSDKLGHMLQLIEKSKVHEQAQKFVSLVETVLDSFAARFPDEAHLIDAVEKID